MKQKIIFFITLLILVNLKAFSLENVNIVFKIDEEIITNIDVKKEAKFLVALNTNLETLNEKKLISLRNQKLTLKEKDRFIRNLHKIGYSRKRKNRYLSKN